MTDVGELDSVAKIVAAFYRAVGSTSADTSLQLRGESADDVAYQLLTRGFRAAQRWMLGCGYIGWRQRSTALSFSGSDSADGGRYASLPSGFLRAYSPIDSWGVRSALVEANGDRWGEEIDPSDRAVKTGNLYYLFETSGTEQLWLARSAIPPVTLYLEYHKAHDPIAAAGTITFPMECRRLAVYEAASLGAGESWFPGGNDLKQSIEAELQRERELAQDYSRKSKRPRRLKPPTRFGNY